MSSYRPIMPLLTVHQVHLMRKPSLYRACVNADPAEYKMVEAKIMKLYKEANK